jgi:hypothetical protein
MPRWEASQVGTLQRGDGTPDAAGTLVASEGDLVTARGIYVDKWEHRCQTGSYFEVMEIHRGGLDTAP